MTISVDELQEAELELSIEIEFCRQCMFDEDLGELDREFLVAQQGIYRELRFLLQRTIERKVKNQNRGASDG